MGHHFGFSQLHHGQSANSPNWLEDWERHFPGVSLADFNLGSRLTYLDSFSGPKAQVFLKRDDELSFGVSGSKVRKFSSLLPYLKQNSMQKVAAVGGRLSHNLLGLAQFLKEWKIEAHFFVGQNHFSGFHPNASYLSLLVEPDTMHFVDTTSTCLATYAKSWAKNNAAFFLPEGSSVAQCLPGAATLAYDVQLDYQHIYLDAGTGGQAVGAAIGLAQRGYQGELHIICAAKEVEIIKDKLLRELRARQLSLLGRLHVQVAATSRSFGAVNATLKGFIMQFTRQEGILLDPLYSGKLLYTLQQDIAAGATGGRVLALHSGGALNALATLASCDG